jgi:hypothetical protein
MSDDKQTSVHAKRPVLISILCYVLLVEAWFCASLSHLPMRYAAQHGAAIPSGLHSSGTALKWLAALYVLSAIGLFFMSRIGYYVLLISGVFAILAAAFMHMNIGILVVQAVMCALAWVFRKKYRWFKK